MVAQIGPWTAPSSSALPASLSYLPAYLPNYLYLLTYLQDLPEYFEDNMGRWMTQFSTLLAFSHRLLVDESEEERPGPLELLRAAIVGR